MKFRIQKTIIFALLFLAVPAILLAWAGGVLAPAAAENSGGRPPNQSSGIMLRLEYGNKVFTYEDRYISPDNHMIADELFSRRINGTYSQKMEIMRKCIAAGSTHKHAVLYTMPLLQQVVDTAIKEINKPPQNSKISFDPDAKPMFKIKREVVGLRVDEQRLYAKIFVALCGGSSAKVKIEPDKITPEVTTQDNISLTKLRTRYSTDYAQSGENRKDNIKLALAKVNGTVLDENQEFSFNKTVGRRTKANGFKESIIILGGKYEEGVGGGVCQASTTLYNAALLSGLKVTSVRNHTLECKYELPSFDAMVNDGTSDLKFRNTGKTPVFIRSYGTDTSAVIEIYGAPLDYEIRRQSEIVYRKNPPECETITDTEYKYHSAGAESGTSMVVRNPHGEMKSVGFLLFYDKRGNFIKREKIREDKYSGVAALVVVAP